MNETVDFKTWYRATFTDKSQRFPSKILKEAGAKYKKLGADAAYAFMSPHMSSAPADFQPPARCQIVAQSRPFEEWPIYKASTAVQEYVYGLTKTDFEACKPGKSKTEHQAWIQQSAVDLHGYNSVQGLNHILPKALNRYEGVITRLTNANEKKELRYERLCEKAKEDGLPIPEKDAPRPVFDADGRLIERPGLNKNIYCYQQVSPQPYVSDIETLDPDAPIPRGVPKDRREIPCGQPGYVPRWQYPFLSRNKYRRMRRYTDGGALPVVIRIGEDWVIYDARGLLRNVRWRRLAPPDLTLRQLLAMFTGDPVIDPVRRLITHTFKAAVLGVHSRRTTKGKASRQALLEVTADQPVALVSIDLGQTNPVAAGYHRVTRVGDDLEMLTVHKAALPVEYLKEIAAYRRASDEHKAAIEREAAALLSAEQQLEVQALQDGQADTVKQSVIARGVDPNAIAWDTMTGHTTYISDYLLSQGRQQDVYFQTNDKKGKPREVKRSDRQWVRMLRPRLSQETRKALNDHKWELDRSSPEFKRLSQRKLELARRIVNYVIKQARAVTGCSKIVIAIENLAVRFFHGSGKRLPGWDQFFVPKAENRWLMQVLHKAFSDLATHRGMVVMEVSAQHTSQCCPYCRHIDGESRNGEQFVCTSCGRSCHADIDVATHNIAQVALTGQALKRPASDDAPKKTKKCKTIVTAGSPKGNGSSSKVEALAGENTTRHAELCDVG